MTKRKTIKRPNDFGTIRRKVDKYKGNLIDGLSQILKLERGVQHYILFCLLCDETLFNQYTNLHINKYFVELETNDEFRNKLKQSNQESGDGDLWDSQLTPMTRGKIISGLQNLIVNGGRKKWEKVLSEITNGYTEGVYI
jgi:hypothetical protein